MNAAKTHFDSATDPTSNSDNLTPIPILTPRDTPTSIRLPIAQSRSNLRMRSATLRLTLLQRLGHQGSRRAFECCTRLCGGGECEWDGRGGGDRGECEDIY